MEKLKMYFDKYRHIVPLLIYGVIYMSWFGYLERTVTKHYTVIHMKVDDYIPFVEVFIIPYLLWFAYIAVVVMYLFFKNKEDYYRACAFLFTGMTVFLIISTVWPNGHHLRLTEMPRDNIFTAMIERLWKTDTATNLWPSIHCYNSIGAYFAVIKNKELAKNKWITWGSFLLSVSIVLSTVFIKQHSMFDVITAFLLSAVMYVVVYHYDILYAGRKVSDKDSKPQIS